MNALYEEYKIILSRRNQTGEGDDKSYTRYLFKEGINKILKKVGEESAELIIAAKDSAEFAGDYKNLVVGETADLFYHVLIMLAALDIPLTDIEAELEARAVKAGNLKERKVVDRNT